MMVVSKNSGPITGMSPSSGILMFSSSGGSFRTRGVRLHERVVEEAGQPGSEHVEHDAEDDLVDQVADREQRQQAADQERPAKAPAGHPAPWRRAACR